MIPIAVLMLGLAVPLVTEGDFVIRDFRFASGETLPELKLHYRTLGRPRSDAAGVVRNAVLVLHGTGGSGAELPGAQPSPASCSARASSSTRPRYFIVLPDGIGHGRSSKPSDGLRARFPRYTYDDMVAAQYRLLTEGLRREPPAPRDGHVDGRHAHLGLGRDAIPTSWTGWCRWPACPPPIAGRNRDDAPDDHRRHPRRPGVEGRRLHGAAARACAAALDVLLMMGSSPLQWHTPAPTRDAADACLAEQMHDAGWRPPTRTTCSTRSTPRATTTRRRGLETHPRAACWPSTRPTTS